jgi:hypothetical protein
MACAAQRSKSVVDEQVAAQQLTERAKYHKKSVKVEMM